MNWRMNILFRNIRPTEEELNTLDIKYLDVIVAKKTKNISVFSNICKSFRP